MPTYTSVMAEPCTPIRVLFVCMGNICRSPAAEIVFRKLVDDAGLASQFQIDSAGTIDYHEGRPPDPRMTAILKSRGYRISGAARAVTPADLRNFDHILVADQENLADLQSLSGIGTHRGKVQLLSDYCTEHEASRIPDPYHGDPREFSRVADLVEDACAGLLRALMPEI